MLLNVRGVRINALVLRGSGPAVILHGAGPAGWELWQLPAELLAAKGWTVVAFDHRGSGSTQADPSTINADNLARDVIGVMDALSIDRTFIGGESMGGVVAMLAAGLALERVRGLLLAVTPPAVTAAARPLWEGWERDLVGFTRWFVDECIPEPESQQLKPWANDVFLRGSARHGHVVMKAMAEPGAAPDLARLDVPAIVVAGTKDTIVPPEVVAATARKLPRAELITVDGMGHAPVLTQPALLAEALVRLAEKA
jgi:pimeloyl-ACP methyl ester carboxylesterase